MFDLFNPFPEDNLFENNSIFENDISKIEGLLYVPNFITMAEEKFLLESINSENWLSDIKRRVQHYGYKYDYKARNIDYSMYLGPIPDWSRSIAERLTNEKFIEFTPDQIIVNEYLPGQGIANHVDCEPCFGSTIITISLNSFCVMDFINIKTKEKIEVLLQPRSLVVINGESRYNWSHGISARKTDYFKEKKISRELRVSLTFRNVILK